MIVICGLLGWNFSAVCNEGHGKIRFLIFFKLSSSCNKLYSLPALWEWFNPHPNPSSQGESVNLQTLSARSHHAVLALQWMHSSQLSTSEFEIGSLATAGANGEGCLRSLKLQS